MRLLMLFLLLLLPGCAEAREQPTTVRPALWKLADDDTTVWLFGTIHLMPANVQWLEPPVSDAFEKADELVIEADVPEGSNQDVVTRLAFDPAALPLDQRLPPDLAQATRAALDAYGVPPAVYEKAELWYLAVILETLMYRQIGLDPGNGVDNVLVEVARRSGKTIVPLESFEQQLGFFDGLSEADQIAMLRSTVQETKESPDRIRVLLDAWEAGDEAALGRVMNKNMEADSPLRSVLLDDRNAHWARWIDARMARPGTIFVAVGAGHLAGRGNVRELLEQKGWTIERVQ